MVGLSLIAPIVILSTESPDRIVQTLNDIFFDKIDIVVTNDDVMIIIPFFLIIIFTIKAILSIKINKKILEFSWEQRTKIISRLMDYYQHISYEVFSKRNSSEFIQIMDGPTGDFSTGVINSSLRVICEFIICFSIFIFLLVQNLEALLLLVFIFGILFFLYNKIFISKVIKYGENAVKGSVKRIQAVSEAINGLKEVRILGKERFFYQTVVKATSFQAKNTIRSQIITMSPKYFIELFLIIFIVTISLVMILTDQGLSYMLTNIAIFGFAAVRLTPSINIIITGLTTIKTASYATKIIHDELTMYASINKIKSRYFEIKNSDLPVFENLKLKDLSFSYSDSKTIIEKASLEIHRGDRVGIIGSSGSGKTTFIDLFLGLLYPQLGEILLNDQPIKDNLKKWQSLIAYLPQENFMIDNSLKANIALELNSERIDENKLLKSIKSSKLEEFVKDLPDGLNTEIGEKGILISGGQRQRMALARAFYHDKQILVLDESTSALDDKTEKEIIDEIGLLSKNVTLIMIAHRLSSLKHCNKIYQINEEKVKLIGDYNELIKKTKN